MEAMMKLDAAIAQDEKVIKTKLEGKQDGSIFKGFSMFIVCS